MDTSDAKFIVVFTVRPLLLKLKVPMNANKNATGISIFDALFTDLNAIALQPISTRRNSTTFDL